VEKIGKKGAENMKITITQDNLIDVAAVGAVDALAVAAKLRQLAAGQRWVVAAAEMLRDDPEISLEILSKAFDILATDPTLDTTALKKIALNFARLAVEPPEAQAQYREQLIQTLLR
jgi:ABC-type ATPase with predicted acetyltransferase domain